MEVKIKKLLAGVATPAYAHKGDACFDLPILIDNGECAPLEYDRFLDKFVPLIHPFDQPNKIVIRSNESYIFRTGLAFEIPEGYVMLIFARSSTGMKLGLELSNGTGVIDSGYRGEVRIALRNCTEHLVEVADGQRVAQAMIVPYPVVDLVESKELSETERGTDGIGSSGV